MIRKVSILEVKSEHLHIFSRFELPRIGATLLATILRDRGFEAEALFLPRKTLLARGIQTDLAGISTITATAPASYAVADDLRRRGIPVVIGGPHASFQPEEALEHGDYCLVGEAEQSLPMLVEALNGGRTLDEVPGLVWRRDGAIVHNPAVRPIDDLDSLPFPDYSLLDMGHRRMGAFLLGGSIVPIQTSRGCPYDCSFCSVTGMFGKRYRFRSTANVMAELEHYQAGQLMFFYDDNFAANSRHTRELLNAMIERNFGFHVVDAGARGHRPRPRAARPDVPGGVPHGVHRLRERRPPGAGRDEEGPVRRRDALRDPRAAPPAHPRARDVRLRVRRRHPRDREGHRGFRHPRAHRLRAVPAAHPAAGFSSSSSASRPKAASTSATGTITTPTTSPSGPRDSRHGSCSSPRSGRTHGSMPGGGYSPGCCTAACPPSSSGSTRTG